MNKTIRNTLLLVIAAFVLILSACGKSSDSGNTAGNTGPVSEQQATVADNPSDSNDTDEGSAAGTELAKILSKSKLPLNYTYEVINESEPNNQGNQQHERVTRKDNFYKIEFISNEGEDQGKAISIMYFDASTKLIQSYDVNANSVIEQTDNNPIESWDSYDPNKSGMKNIEMYEQAPFKNIGEESVDKNVCTVFEVNTQDMVARFYVSKEYNIVLKSYVEIQGNKQTMTYSNFKAGQVTDDMVKPDFPKDAVITKQ